MTKGQSCKETCKIGYIWNDVIDDKEYLRFLDFKILSGGQAAGVRWVNVVDEHSKKTFKVDLDNATNNTQKILNGDESKLLNNFFLTSNYFTEKCCNRISELKGIPVERIEEGA